MSSRLEVRHLLVLVTVLLACGAPAARSARPAPPDRPTTLAAGMDHACAWVHGALQCWGRNDGGQVSPWPSTSAHRGAPVTPMSAWAEAVPSSVRDLALGFEHSCVLTGEARVRCFGARGNSQALRASVGLGEDEPVLPDGVNDIALSGTPTSIDANRAATCATTAEGPVYCWGLISQLRCDADLGSSSSLNLLCGVRAEPIELLPLIESVGVSIGDERICGWTERGRLTCIEHDRDAETRTAARVVLSSGVDEACLARAGDEEMLCVRRGGVVQCGVGQGETGAALSDVTALACGDGVCAARADGSVWCSDDLRHFSRVPLLADALSVAVGEGFACAQREGGAVACWGEGADGQLGWSSRVRRAPTLDGEHLYSAGAQLCGVRYDGRGNPSVRCLGRGEEGAPAVVDDEGRAAMGGGHLRCVLKRDAGELWCRAGEHVMRRAFPDGEDAYEVRAFVEGARACVLWPDGEAECASADFRSGEPAWEPLAGLTEATALAIDGAGLCAVRRDGSVWCREEARERPARSGLLEGIDDARALAMDFDQRCVLRDSGAVACWSATSSSAPRAVPLPFEVRALEAAWGRFCALGDTQVACWGHGQQGQLNGRPGVSSLEPLVVPGLPALEQIAMADTLTCGLTPAGQAWCWGLRAEPSSSASPTPVDLPDAEVPHATAGHEAARGHGDRSARVLRRVHRAHRGGDARAGGLELAPARSRVVSLPERDRARAHTAPVGGDTMAADLLSRGSRELAAAAWWLGGG